MLNSSNYACPLCAQSLLNLEKYWKQLDTEIANTPMPDEYKNFSVYILCRDCHKVAFFLASQSTLYTFNNLYKEKSSLCKISFNLNKDHTSLDDLTRSLCEEFFSLNNLCQANNVVLCLKTNFHAAVANFKICIVINVHFELGD